MAIGIYFDAGDRCKKENGINKKNRFRSKIDKNFMPQGGL